jgi:hypothetical protein
MRKIYFALLTFCALSASAQVITFSPNDTITTNLVIANGTDQVEATLTAANPGTATKNIRWTLMEANLQSGWTDLQICDPQHCWVEDTVGSTHSFNLTAGGSGLFKVDFISNCAPGPGKVRLKTWEPADSANTTQYITFSFDLTASANCATGVAEFKTDNIRFYPNPVKEELKIIGATGIKNMRADVFNVIGSKVLSKSFENNGAAESEIGAEGLDQGVYFVKLYSNNKLIATKKFSKE